MFRLRKAVRSSPDIIFLDATVSPRPTPEARPPPWRNNDTACFLPSRALPIRFRLSASGQGPAQRQSGRIMMDSKQSDRRQFLKQAAAGLAGGAAGLAVGANLPARSQTVASADFSRGVPADGEAQLQTHVHSQPPRRGARYSIDHMTHYTPLQDYMGIITPAPVHFVQQHSSEFPDIDASQH